MSRDELDDVHVREWLERAGDDIEVDVDLEWLRFRDRLAREAEEIDSMRPRGERGGRVVPWSKLRAVAAVAAVVLLVLAMAGPALVRTSVSFVRFVQEVVDGPPTTVAPTVETTVETTLPLPPVTTSTPPPSTTAVPAGTDAAHEEIVNGDAYRLTIREVHEQLNAAIGYGRMNFEELEGADALIESLLGQRPQFDARLRDTIGHLRQAMRARDRNAASAAHTIINDIETELASER